MKNKILIVCVLPFFLDLLNVSISEVSFAVEQQRIKVIPEQILTTEEIEAKAVLISFFNALVDSDTRAIEELLGGKLLKKRKRLLNNPNYSEFLAKRYRDTRFEIINYKRIKENRIQIDVKIILNEQESMRVRYFLEKTTDPTDLTPNFRIHEEREQTND